MVNEEAIEVKKVFYICDKKACNTCHKECKHTSDITHAVNFGIGGHGDFFEDKRETLATNENPREITKINRVCFGDGYIIFADSEEKAQEIKNALEKQIPKKPHRNYEHCSVQWCNCGWYLGRKEEGRVYCSRCGQKIDWRN